MQSGRIMPVIRQFFSSQVQGNRPMDSHAGQGGQQQPPPEKEPTREEVQAALEALTGQEEFRKQNLKAFLKEIEGRFVIAVFDSNDHPLKMIAGQEIFRVLGGKVLGREGHVLGRILDRRV
jgi:hypothetical protein